MAYPFGFKAFTTADLAVVKKDASGVLTTLALTTDYSVSLNADQNTAPGGLVTMVVALPVGYTLTISTAVAATQGASLTNGGAFFAQVIENALDRVTVLIQQILSGVSRLSGVLQFPYGDTASGQLPSAASRAGYLLAFDSSGNPTTAAPVSGSTSALTADMINTTDVAKGDALIGVKSTLTGAVATTQHAKNADTLSITDFGGSSAASAVANKAALQLAITGVNTSGNPGVIVIPHNCAYGYKVADSTSWPSFSGITQPVLVIDYSLGADYGTYPTTYEGAQERRFYFTPQTTTPGLHDGNTTWLRAAWAPNYCISNDMNLSGARLASDNRRALFTTFVNGIATWTMGQGAQSGAALTDEELGNFLIQKYAATYKLLLASSLSATATSAVLAVAWPNASGTWSVTFSNGDVRTVTFTQTSTAITWAGGLTGAATTAINLSDTLGSYTPLVIERKTGNWAINVGTNAPQFGVHFKSNVTGYQQMCLESLTTTGDLVMRNSNGSADDVYLRNSVGDCVLRIASQGDALTVTKANRRVTVAQSFVQKRAIVTYSASMTIDAAAGNFFTITATNSTAFAINAPTNPGDGQDIYVKLSNTSGGALGAITPNAVFKLVGGAWPSPSTGNNITVTLVYDGGNWFEVSRSGTVPN